MRPAVILDLDGTLWDTVTICAHAWSKVVAESGLERGKVTREELRGGMGLTADALRARMFPALEASIGRRVLEACLEREIVEIDSAGSEGVVFYPGVLEGVPRLARSYALYLVSNCDGPYLKAFFRVSGLGEWFRDSECHGNTKRSKGENILAVMRRNGVERAVYVGDTEVDREASAFAGIPLIFARYGFGHVAASDGAIGSFGELERELVRFI